MTTRLILVPGPSGISALIIANPSTIGPKQIELIVRLCPATWEACEILSRRWNVIAVLGDPLWLGLARLSMPDPPDGLPLMIIGTPRDNGQAATDLDYAVVQLRTNHKAILS